jgi:hypothetical protein
LNIGRDYRSNGGHKAVSITVSVNAMRPDPLILNTASALHTAFGIQLIEQRLRMARRDYEARYGKETD